MLSPFTATLVTGLLLFVPGVLLLAGGTSTGPFLKALPRSVAGAIVLFGGAAVWFLSNVAHISQADLIFFSTPTPLVVGFGVLAVLAFRYAPDFLAVRGLASLVLLGAWPLLMAGFMKFEQGQIVLYKAALFAGAVLALWLGAQPWRMRDFLGWLFGRPVRVTALGGLLAGYGLMLVAVAFTY